MTLCLWHSCESAAIKQFLIGLVSVEPCYAGLAGRFAYFRPTIAATIVTQTSLDFLEVIFISFSSGLMMDSLVTKNSLYGCRVLS